jgi:hypothetical protein
MDNSDAELVTNDWTEPTTAAEPVVSGAPGGGPAADSTGVTGSADEDAPADAAAGGSQAPPRVTRREEPQAHHRAWGAR